MKVVKLRILVCNRPGGAFGYISDGWINAFRDKGHVVQRWDGNQDSWHNFCPHLYIGCSGHKQPIPSHSERSTKVAIHVNPYGPVQIASFNTLINESENNIQWTLTQKPDVVFGYGHADDQILWSYWTTKHGIPWIPLPTAGDKTIFHRSQESDKKYDIVYLGGRWAYKAITIDKYLLPLLRKDCQLKSAYEREIFDYISQLSYKLHGWGEWPAGICSGALAEDQVCKFLGSGRIGPCISEQHTHRYGIDIPERAFKLALCGTMIIHDSVMQIRRMIPSAVIAENHDKFANYCCYYSRPEATQERIEITNRQTNEVLAAHTYHHRMSVLLNSIGYHKEAEDMIQ